MPRCPNCRTKIVLPTGGTAFNCYSCLSPLKLRSEVVRYLLSEIVFLGVLIALLASGLNLMATFGVSSAAGVASWFWFETFSLTHDLE